jgi:hypothetical protein
VDVSTLKDSLMSPSQIHLLQQLIAADRQYRTRIARREHVHPDDRGIEVTYLTGVHMSTARALVNAGLAEMLTTTRNCSPWLFLGNYEPYDE